MNKIIDVKINNKQNQIILIIDSEAILTEDNIVLFVDECTNIRNLESEDSSMHSYSFSIKNSQINIQNISANQYNIVITNNLIQRISQHIKYMKLYIQDSIYMDYIYYNPIIIYETRISKLNCCCDVCQSNRTLELNMLVTFRLQMLELAIKTNDYTQALRLYKQICRLLQIRIYDPIFKYSPCITTEYNECIQTECGVCIKSNEDIIYKIY